MEKKSGWEKFSGFWEKLHMGLGAIALAGAAVFPAEQAKLVLFSVWEFGHAFIWNSLKNVGKKKLTAASNTV